MSPQRCFVAGTLVLTSEGLRPIEEVAVGDQVLAMDEATGKLRFRPVVRLFETPAQPIYEITIESATGETETISTTAEHPFWVADLGWVPASRLMPGDVLRSTNTEAMLRVRQVRGSPQRETVYNFEVAEDHNYFVGEAQVWVHNLCAEGQARLAELRQRRADRLAGTVEVSRPEGLQGYLDADRRIQAEAASLGGGVRPHPSDPHIPGGITNHRGRFQAGLSHEGLGRLPNDWDVHHTNPRHLARQGHPLVEGVDIHNPLDLRGVPGSSGSILNFRSN